MAKGSPQRTKAFISYSHADRAYLARLQVHLKPFLREGTIQIWDDTQIQPGATWYGEIKQALNSTKVAILLVSADYLASDFIVEEELPELFIAAAKEGALILPVILNPSSLDRTPLSQFQSINDPEQPVSALQPFEQEQIWMKVANIVVDALKTKEDWLEEGKQQQAKRYDKSLTAYGRAIELDAEYVPAYCGKAEVFYELGRYEDALATYEQAIQVDPTDAYLHRNKGDILRHIPRYKEALVAYEQAIKLKNDDPFLYRSKADMHLELENYTEALVAYERAIALKADDATFHRSRGDTLCRLNRYEEAVDAYNQALQLDTTFGGAYAGKGWALFNQQLFSEALVAYEQAIASGFSYAYVYCEKGQTLGALDRYEEAIISYDEAITRERTYRLAWRKKGQALLST